MCHKSAVSAGVAAFGLVACIWELLTMTMSGAPGSARCRSGRMTRAWMPTWPTRRQPGSLIHDRRQRLST